VFGKKGYHGICNRKPHYLGSNRQSAVKDAIHIAETEHCGVLIVKEVGVIRLLSDDNLLKEWREIA